MTGVDARVGLMRQSTARLQIPPIGPNANRGPNLGQISRGLLIRVAFPGGIAGNAGRFGSITGLVRTRPPCGPAALRLRLSSALGSAADSRVPHQSVQLCRRKTIRFFDRFASVPSGPVALRSGGPPGRGSTRPPTSAAHRAPPGQAGSDGDGRFQWSRASLTDTPSDSPAAPMRHRRDRTPRCTATPGPGAAGTGCPARRRAPSAAAS